MAQVICNSIFQRLLNRMRFSPAFSKQEQSDLGLSRDSWIGQADPKLARANHPYDY